MSDSGMYKVVKCFGSEVSKVVKCQVVGMPKVVKCLGSEVSKVVKCPDSEMSKVGNVR